MNENRKQSIRRNKIQYVLPNYFVQDCRSPKHLSIFSYIHLSRPNCISHIFILSRPNCICLSGTRLSGIRLSGIRLSGIRLSGQSGIRLSGIRVSGIRVSGLSGSVYPVSVYPVSIYPVSVYPVSVYPVSVYPVSFYPVSGTRLFYHAFQLPRNILPGISNEASQAKQRCNAFVLFEIKSYDYFFA